MNKQLPTLAGLLLILVGLLAFACILPGPLLSLNVWHWGPWRLWPLIVVCAGLLFVVLPLLARGRRGLGVLFIPGVPILTTGSILLFASVFDIWSVWEWLWPQEVLAVALGFLFAAMYMRTIWLLIPAIIIGANGVLFQFCALTGWWDVWTVLWTVEPLAVGLSLLVVGARKRSSGLLVGGVAMCLLAGLGTVESLAIVAFSALFPAWWLWKWVGPVTFILVGVAMLGWGLMSRLPVAGLTTD